MEQSKPALEPLTPNPAFAVLGQQDPLLQELWAIKAQINKEAQYSVDVRCKQVQELNWAIARARVGLAAA